MQKDPSNSIVNAINAQKAADAQPDPARGIPISDEPPPSPIKLEAWEVYADREQFGQLETEALEHLTNHASADDLYLVIHKLRRLAFLRYGKLIALVGMLFFLPGCVTLGPTSVSYDPATGGWNVSSTALRKAAKAVEILDSK